HSTKSCSIFSGGTERLTDRYRKFAPREERPMTTNTTKSLSPETMENRVARFNKLQTYQQQNFAAHGIPPGAVEMITARRVYPVMAPADYKGRSAGAPVK